MKTILSLCQGQKANQLLDRVAKKENLRLIFLNKAKNGIFPIDHIINQADLVMGLGRSAYDAMSCGRPLIAFDTRGYNGALSDGYLSARNIDKSLKYNCSGRAFRLPVNYHTLVQEIKKYDPKDGQFLRSFALENLNIAKAVNSYLSLYKK